MPGGVPYFVVLAASMRPPQIAGGNPEMKTHFVQRARQLQ